MASRRGAREVVGVSVFTSLYVREFGRPASRDCRSPEFHYDRFVDDVRASSRIEAALAQIWRELLAVAEVGPHDDFFKLGGDSLRRSRCSRRRRGSPDADRVPDFMDAPTVAGLVASIGLRDDGPKLADVPTDAAPSTGPAPCSFAQERLWFLSQLTGPTGAYNMPLGARIRGGLDTRALELALVEVVARHNALRTTFAATAGGTPTLAVSDDARLELQSSRRQRRRRPDDGARRWSTRSSRSPSTSRGAPRARAAAHARRGRPRSRAGVRPRDLRRVVARRHLRRARAALRRLSRPVRPRARTAGDAVRHPRSRGNARR